MGNNRDWIVLDTETTGFDPKSDRIIEIGAVRIRDRVITDEIFHHYLQPDRLVNPSAIAVHGITDQFLLDKKRFKDIADSFIEWVADGVLIIHNAPFDVGFLNMELTRHGFDPLERYISDVIDTLVMARSKHRGKKNDLNTLLARYDVENNNRKFHGALLDATLLAQLFLRMTQCQEKIVFESVKAASEVYNKNFLQQDSGACPLDASWIAVGDA